MAGLRRHMGHYSIDEECESVLLLELEPPEHMGYPSWWCYNGPCPGGTQSSHAWKEGGVDALPVRLFGTVYPDRRYNSPVIFLFGR